MALITLQLIMDCSFKRSLEKKSWKADDLSGGCDHFDQTLTSKGLCYSFNGYSPSAVWRPSKLVTELDKKYERQSPNQKFAGAGSNEGKF